MTRLDEIKKIVGGISLKYQSRDSGGETEVDLFAVVAGFYELGKVIEAKDKQLAEAFVKWLGECPTCGVQPDLDDGKLDHWGKCKYNEWLQEQRKAENINYQKGARQ